MPKIDNEIQAPPFCMQIELTEGCNLRCPFCGLNGIRGKENNLKFMDLSTVERITEDLQENGWRCRIEFAMHGEPSLHPQFIKVLSMFRKRLPRTFHLMVTSNGGGLLKDPTLLIDQALEYVNVLALDAYENVSIVPKILERYKGQHTPTFYPKDKTGNPHRRRSSGQHDLVIVQDIKRATAGTHASLNNHAGAGAPLNDNAEGKRCAKPFRELSIRWDGNVAVCCNDWRGLYHCGSIHTMSLDEIWQSPGMRAARRKLYHGMRDFGPCQGCDALSYRPGLLPDQRGKQTLPEPTAADERVIKRALADGPLTLPVLRPWELPAQK